MKALTLTQPWATLVALGAKQVETRSWSTSHRGPLAIHAAKGLGPVGGELGLRELCAGYPFAGALGRLAARPDLLPRGQIVAVCDLWDVFSTHQLAISPDGGLEGVSSQEELFGNYAPGRFGFRLRSIRRLVTPVPCRGALGLWDVPDVIVRGLDG